MAGEYITGLLESAIAAADRTDPALALSPIQPEASPSRDAGRSAVSPEPAPPFRFHLVSATPMATRDGDAAGIRAPPPLPSSQGEGLLLPEVFVDAPDVEMASNPFSPDSDCQRQQRLSASSTSSGEGVDPLGGFASLSLPGRRGSRFVLQARSQSQSLSNGSGLFLTDICQSLVASRRESIAATTFHNVGVVLPHKLFVTSARHAFDSEEMSAFNITAFLCVAEEVDPPFPPFAKPEQCLHLKLKDIATTQLSEYIPTVMDFVDTQNELGNTVVLYCQAGKSRSVSFAIAFLMRELGLEADAALQELRAGYARAEPNTFFMLQLLNSSIGQEVNPLTSP